MWHRPLLHVSYLPIQVLKTSLVKTELQVKRKNFKIACSLTLLIIQPQLQAEKNLGTLKIILLKLFHPIVSYK